ncbi:two-partner secretion domain-containing protein [Baaleninema simplex]|uniref:two-partner secretion domain-containing protein n=1 Tax=Baaleninema simplex TaxID=2862350 RepID=UPI00034CB489|nr:filamentous hemagglutinin N-terminal domain-containing protein [Baaleninema simplex]
MRDRTSLIFLTLYFLAFPVRQNAAQAQIVPDGTLGTESSTISPTDTGVQIDGGALRGNNLFHSFEEFSVPTNREALFNNALEVQNIFSRVTGRSISNIDGLLRANGTANLFLLNPNGIIFGPNAQLNIGGSFLASTADSVLFENGLEFNATNPENSTALLSVNVPLGLQFNDAPGAIQARGSALTVPNGEALTLVGGEISLNSTTLEAPGGRVELAAASHPGNAILQESRVELPVELTRLPISLNGTDINVLGSSGGEIAVSASDLTIQSSFLSAGIVEGAGFPGARAGDIELNATGHMAIGAGSFIRNDVRVSSTGNAGDVTVFANTIEVREGAVLSSSTLGQGDSGSISIEATDTAFFSGSAVGSGVGVDGQGNAGKVWVLANTIEVRDAGELNSNTFGEGNAGTISIEATDTVVFSNGFALSNVLEDGQGHGGDVRIFANAIEILDGGQLSSSTDGEGNAGTISIEATDTVLFSGVSSVGASSGAFSQVGEEGRGNAGEVRVVANTVEIRDGAVLDSSTLGEGDAGTVSVEAIDTVIFSDISAEGFASGAASNVEEEGRGNAGEVRVVANTVEIRDGAQLSSSTSGEGNAGTISLEATDAVFFSGMGSEEVYRTLLSIVEEGGRGNAGDIRVVANTIEVRNGAVLNSSTLGEGDAGTVSFIATDAVVFSSGGAVSGVIGQGNAGNVNIVAGSVEVRDGALLSSSTLGEGDAGNVSVTATDSVFFSNGNAFSNVEEGGQGNAGGINVVANTVEVRDAAQLSSSTLGLGDAGTVSVVADTVIFSGANSEGFSGAARSTVEEGGQGNAGDIRVVANTVEVSNGALLTSSTLGIGDAGTVSIEATGTVVFSGVSPAGFSSGAVSNVAVTGRGNAGDVRVVANTIEVRDGASLNSSTLGIGDAGTVSIEASDSVLFFNGNALSAVEEGGIGNAGGISVIANTVEVSGGAQLDSSTLGEGDAGTVRVEASDTIVFSGVNSEQSPSAAFSVVGNGGRGNAGNVRVVANTVEVRDGASLNSSTLGIGNAGTVSVEASDSVVFSNGVALSEVVGEGQGNAGDVRVLANTVEVRDGSLLSSINFSNNFNQFSAGSVIVQADSIHMTESGMVAFTIGRGGNIQLDAQVSVLRNGSFINTNAGGIFPGGNITIDTGVLAALENSDISANALNSAGGRVIIDAQGIFGTQFRNQLTPESDITATSELGAEFSGTVELNTPNIDTTSGLVDLSANPVDAAAILATDPCATGRDSEFYITGRGGLPPNPESILPGNATWVDLRSPHTATPELTSTPDDETAQLVEAQGWYVNSEGNVVLSAQTANAEPNLPQPQPDSCSPNNSTR